MRHLLAALAVVAGVLSAHPAVAEACFCGPACGSIRQAQTLFEATVTDVVSAASGGAERIVRLADVRMLRGRVAPDHLVAFVGDSCAYQFKIGTRYLIDATQFQQGRFAAQSCGNTAPLADAAGLLASLVEPAATLRPRVWGRVVSPWADQYLRAARLPRPVPDAVVTLSGPVTRSTTTSANGDFAFVARDLPDGVYTVAVDLPAARTDVVAPAVPSVTLDHAAACASLRIEVRSTARLTGRVVDRGGRPVSGVPVQVFPLPFDWWAARRNDVAFTDSDGNFVLDGLSPGRYGGGVAVPYPTDEAAYRPAMLRTPGGAAELDIAPGATVTLPALAVVPAPVIAVAGRVLNAAGGAVADAFLVVSALDGFPDATTGGVRTNVEGRFAVDLHRGVRYRIEVERGGRVVASHELSAGPRVVEIRIHEPQ